MYRRVLILRNPIQSNEFRGVPKQYSQKVCDVLKKNKMNNLIKLETVRREKYKQLSLFDDEK